MDVGNLITGSSAFLKSSLNLYNFLVHVLLKPSLENFEYYFLSEAPEKPSDGCSLMRDPEPDYPAKLLPDY